MALNQSTISTPVCQAPSFPQSEISAPPGQFASINHAELAVLQSCTGIEIKVYLALAIHADETNRCWPGRARVASLAGILPVHVSRATNTLANKGLLIKEILPSGKILYTLPLHPIPQQAEPVPRPVPHRYQGRYPEHISEQTKEQREPVRPEPANREPDKPPLSTPKVKIESRIGLPEDWKLPEDWLEQTRQERPDLDLAVIQASAENFRDYQISQGRQSANWRYEWRRWIRRERSQRNPSQAPQRPQEGRQACHEAYRPVERTEADRQADIAAWQQRMERLGKPTQPATVPGSVQSRLAALRQAAGGSF